MTAATEKADNLLLRLVSYTPRQDRTPLEDFCTEVLAWCLRNSSAFTQNFLNLTRIDKLKGWSPEVDVQTQLTFSGEESDEEVTDTSGGRFDLVLESGVEDRFVMVVESKIWADFGAGQLEKYRQQLNNSPVFSKVPSRYLVTLTSQPCNDNIADGRILWREVHQALEAGPGDEPEFVQGIFKQFAQFLKEKGLAMLKLNPVTTQQLEIWKGGKEFELQLLRILQALVEHLKSDKRFKSWIGRKRIKLDDPEWIGIDGQNDFWAGFAIAKIHGQLQPFMWVEITVPGDWRDARRGFNAEQEAACEYIKPHIVHYEKEHAGVVNLGNLTKDQKSRFIFGAPLQNDPSGTGDAALDWLKSFSEKAIDLAVIAETASK